MQKVWLITGCSTGFGRELAKEALQQGHKVIVTARNTSQVEDIVELYPATAIALPLDVTKQEDIDQVAENGVNAFGRIDVLVNNAGIGYFGAVEESEDEETRRMFEINFWGLANMTKAILPVMRKQRSGHIINISSVAGMVGNPGVGFYNATKFAVNGLSEALAKEVAPMGIKVTIICPSGFRTDWAGRSANNSKTIIDDYTQTARKNVDAIRGYSGNQPGDPLLAAKAIVNITEVDNPPLYLLLGVAALRGTKNKLTLLQQDLDTWEQTTITADSPKT